MSVEGRGGLEILRQIGGSELKIWAVVVLKKSLEMDGRSSVD